MQRVSRVFALLIAVLSGVLVSCDKDSHSDYFYVGDDRFYVSYGVVVGTQEAYTIRTDVGNTLIVVENLCPSFAMEDSMRVRINYTIDRQTSEGFEIRLNAIEKILSKAPVYSTELTSDELADLGDDPIEVAEAWFGGNYLNINFLVFRYDPALAHFINLLVDEENSTEDDVVVILKHNAYDDPTTSLAFSRVSFDLSDLVPIGQESVKITLKWTDYNDSEHMDSGEFVLNDFTSSTTLVGEEDEQSTDTAVGTIK